MWASIALIGSVMAIGALLVLDSSLPGGLLAGSGDMRHAQTVSLTTIVFFSLFTAVIYVPFLQQAFSTAALSDDWLKCAAVGSCVLWLTEGMKLLLRKRSGRKSAIGNARSR